MKLRIALLAATVLALPIAANAQVVTGPYVSLGMGYDYLMQTNVKNIVVSGVGQSTVSNYNYSDNGGFTGQGSFGWGFGNGFRAEIEGNYIAEHANVGGGYGVAGGGNFQTYGFLINGIYDFNVPWAVKPYLGLGAGYEFSAIQDGTLYTTNQTPKGQININRQAQGVPAAQAIVGVAYPLAGVPGLSLTAEYRFLSTLTQPSYTGTTSNGNAVSLKVGNQLHNSVLLGIRYAFNAAPAAPPPAPAPVAAPAPAPARSYLVFFDWDKADLSARAKQIIAEAAQASTRVAVTKIEVNGYADRTGSSAYNQTLSVKRAQNVAAELVRLGVPKASISIQGFGDTHLLVPTAEGVREPQNRRVEIILK